MCSSEAGEEGGEIKGGRGGTGRFAKAVMEGFEGTVRIATEGLGDTWILGSSPMRDLSEPPMVSFDIIRWSRPEDDLGLPESMDKELAL